MHGSNNDDIGLIGFQFNDMAMPSLDRVQCCVAGSIMVEMYTQNKDSRRISHGNPRPDGGGGAVNIII